MMSPSNVSLLFLVVYWEDQSYQEYVGFLGALDIVYQDWTVEHVPREVLPLSFEGSLGWEPKDSATENGGRATCGHCHV